MDVIRETRACLFLLFGFFLLPAFHAMAQSPAVHDFTTVASPILVTGSANNGDIVSYHSDADLFKTSGSFADESMFGVIVDDPVLYLESQLALTEGARPVVRHGEVMVNVSTLGGEIQAGDIITTSPIIGIGQKALRQDATYILGFALDKMILNGERVIVDGKEIQLGTVPVALRIGPFLTQEGITFVTAGKEYVNRAGGFGGFVEGASREREDITGFKVLRYILAALIAMTSIIVSVGRFSDAFRQGVVSVGRNPLARSQIRAMLFWNVVMILAVSGAGLGIAMAIILMP